MRNDGLPHHLAEELFLVWEVEVDGAFGEAGALGDVVEARSREPTFTEDLECRRQDLLRSFVGEPAPARLLRD